jgi:NADH:ubiquinone oxidoreductase subunit F (NADH-binding)
MVITQPLVRPESRLLAGWYETGTPADLPAHLRRYGPLPLAGRGPESRRFIAEVTDSGLRGRGGGGFPTGRKLAAVAAARTRAAVVVNACEGEPASEKDAVLLALAPHLVLDGAVAAAVAVNAVAITVCVHEGAVAAQHLAAALGERDDPIGVTVVEIPQRYVASQETALVHYLDTGDARPTAARPRPAERGVGGRPTLVSNAETFAHLALVARFGAAWFRAAGTGQHPGTHLVTVGGAVHRPGVHEVEGGTAPDVVIARAGGPTAPVQAILVGGYGGTWVRPGGPPGPGVAMLLVLPEGACGLTQTAHILRYLADESAGQCGPCAFGLPAIADDLADLADPARGHASAATGNRLQNRLRTIAGRGACAHPDGTARFLVSALEVFEDDVRRHLSGHGCGRPVLGLLGGTR